jgi:alpha-beta hydrolase superfamily lysophospholipase
MSAPRLRLVPLHFGAPEAPLFGWYHPPGAPDGRVRRCGVVVCNPVGDDYVRAHRALRHFAERLQRAGFAVLRFDFGGTGDSAGDERDPERVRAWIGDVGRAADELRARSGADEICLAGLKLGATLAMLAAAERGDVDGLILWSPYLNGAAYVGETTKLHKMHKMLEPESFAVEPRGWDAGGEEALGFLLTRETIEQLKPLDLLETRRPARRALVIGAGNVPAEERLLNHLKSNGVDTDYRHIPGQKFLIMIPHKASVPGPVLDAMVGWLVDQYPDPAVASAPAPREQAAFAFPEEPIFFGAGDALFGILTRPPAQQRRRDRPAIIMTNAGTVHRIGPHRFYVGLARRWAALGFYVLRMDLPGIGDSPAPADCRENLCYPRDGIAKVQEAMSALSARLDAERFLLVGLCSGADIAFQTGYKDSRVAGTVMINPRTFCVHDLEMVETYKRARYYFDALIDRNKLKRLLRGQVELGRAVAMLVENVKGIWSRRRANDLTQEQLNDVPACLKVMARRGVDTFLVASEHDPGVEYVDMHFGRGMRALSGVKGFRRADFKGTDHTFTSIFAQQLVANTITDHFTGRYLP